MPESYVEAWEDELPVHPIVAELRAQPGRWAILPHPRDEATREPWDACKRHPNVQVYSQGLSGDVPFLYKARWLPDPVVAAMQVLKGGGYGD